MNVSQRYSIDFKNTTKVSRRKEKKKQRKETMKWQFLNIKQDFQMQAHRKPNTP